jgi:hypothetical protein
MKKQFQWEFRQRWELRGTVAAESNVRSVLRLLLVYWLWANSFLIGSGDGVA